MKMIPSREMAARPAAIWKALKAEGAVIVTRNGQPEGVFLATSPDSWLEDIQDFVFNRARRATQQIRQSASKNGLDHLATDDIDAEIRAARDDRNA